MKTIVRILIVSILLFAVCGCGDDDLSGVDSGLDSGVDSGPGDSGTDDPDLNFTFDPGQSPGDDSIESMSILFDCPTEVTVPADFVAYKDWHLVKDFALYSRFLAAAWIDEDCFNACDLGTTLSVCVEADCVTGDGATIQYRYEEEIDEVTNEDMDVNTKNNETFVIEPPTGAETWTRLEVEVENTSYSLSMGGWAGTESTYGINWIGSLNVDWPADMNVLASYQMTQEEGASYATTWSYQDCSLSIYNSLDDAYVPGAIDVQIGVNTVEAQYTSFDQQFLEGWVNSVCAGEIDPYTWEILGPCE